MEIREGLGTCHIPSCSGVLSSTPAPPQPLADGAQQEEQAESDTAPCAQGLLQMQQLLSAHTVCMCTWQQLYVSAVFVEPATMHIQTNPGRSAAARDHLHGKTSALLKDSTSGQQGAGPEQLYWTLLILHILQT